MRILCRGLAAPSLCLNSVRTFASSSRIFRRAIPIPFESPSTSPSHAHTSHTAPSPQWTPTCPSPTCDCVPMPPDLDIDRESPLANTMPHYAEQVIVCSGKEDWPSRIEDEEGGVGKFVRGMRSALGMGKGQCGALDPFHNISLLASSFPPSKAPDTVSAFLFPSFKYIPNISNTDTARSRFASGFLRAEKLHPAHSKLTQAQKKAITRDPSAQKEFPQAKDVEDITVLICGHGGRDQRCGVLGPILRDEFARQLSRKGVTVTEPPPPPSSQSHSSSTLDPPQSHQPDPPTNLPFTLPGDLLDTPISAQIGLISHIGGHKFAGNVIIYLPPTMTGHPLRGMGVWYGRVTPQHVEGIVEETVLKGRVVKELWRGAVRGGKDGERELGRGWDLHGR